MLEKNDEIYLDKEKKKNISPLDQQRINESKSTQDVKAFELTLLKDSKKDLDELVAERNKANPDQKKIKRLREKLTLKNRLENISQNAKTFSDLAISINRMFAADPNLINRLSRR